MASRPGGGAVRLSRRQLCAASPTCWRCSATDPGVPRIERPVAALVGPVNSYATFRFPHLAKRSGVIRPFGEETGGNLKGTIGGGFFFVRLPASEIEFDLPLIGYFPKGPRRDGGVEPDVRIAPTAADIAAGRDPAMSAAVAWVNAARP